MPKHQFDLSAASAFNRAPAQLTPGVLRISNATDAAVADVYIYGDIGGYWDGVEAESFVKELAALDVDTITVHINSPGGLVFDGLAIYNALVGHKAQVIVKIEGIAASIASVIAMAGDEVHVGESANIMIHKPWSGIYGNADDMRRQAEVLDGLEDGLIGVYSARTGKTADDLKPLLAAETWYLGQKAVDEGFADQIIPNKKKAAKSALLNCYNNTPIDLRGDNGHSPQVREFERLLREGEQCSHSQAKRLAALAAKAFANDAPRDEDVAQVVTTEDPRIAEAQQIAATIRSLHPFN